MIFVAILIVIFVIISLFLHFFDQLPRLFSTIEQHMSTIYLFLSIGSVTVLILSLALSYIGFSHAFIFCALDLIASALAGYYFYKIIAAQPISDDFFVDIPIAAWGAVIFGLAVSFIPSVIAASVVYFINMQTIKKNECYKKFLHYLDSLLPTSRLYKVIITSEKVVLRSPTDSLWYMYFSDVGFDELYGRAYNAFVAATASELSRFRKSALEDYCVVFTNKPLHKFLKKAKRQRKRDEKAGIITPNTQLTTGLSDIELAYADERQKRESQKESGREAVQNDTATDISETPADGQKETPDSAPAADGEPEKDETLSSKTESEEDIEESGEQKGPGFFKDDPYSIGEDEGEQSQ